MEKAVVLGQDSTLTAPLNSSGIAPPPPDGGNPKIIALTGLWPTASCLRQ